MASAPSGIDRSRPPEPGPLRPFTLPEIHRASLSNRLPVVVAEVHDLPVVTMSLLLDAGGTHEPEKLAGLASLTAALLESGAGERSAGEIAEAAEMLGISLDTAASWDTAQASFTGLRSRLEPAAEILADLVRRPTFPQDEIERLRQERLAQIVQRRADPRALAGEMAVRFIFAPDSPFARPLAGTTRTIGQLTRPDVAAFHATRYVPGVATLLVVGDVTVEEAVALAEERFGDWAGTAEPAPTPEVRPRSEQPQVVIVHRPGSVQSEIRVGHLGVERRTPDYFPLLVMNAILGGAFTSRLNLNLRERHGYTYGASSGFAMRRQPGPFLASAAVQTEVTHAAVTEILREVEGMRAEPVSTEELQDARNYLAGIFPLRMQTTDGVAGRLAESVIYDLPPDHIARYRERVLVVEAEEVLRVAREHLHPERVAVVVVGDAAQIREPLEQLGIGEVQVVDPAAEEI
ncbi:MAG: M16 family metallopeptidase [Longimicrobiaceae bacterium]